MLQNNSFDEEMEYFKKLDSREGEFNLTTLSNEELLIVINLEKARIYEFLLDNEVYNEERQKPFYEMHQQIFNEILKEDECFLGELNIKSDLKVQTYELILRKKNKN